MVENALVHPVYFGSIAQWSLMLQAKKISFEACDNYQKQTYRNRQHIYGANGKLLLNIPIKHTGDKHKRKLTKEVAIENSFAWQKNHFKSLEAAYRSSPFFEFYEDEFISLYNKAYTSLWEFNLDAMQAIANCLQIDWNPEFTATYQTKPTNAAQFDGRYLVDAKGSPQFKLNDYSQVFEEKHGFIPNLSIIDLLFNEGNNAASYLLATDLSK